MGLYNKVYVVNLLTIHLKLWYYDVNGMIGGHTKDEKHEEVYNSITRN